MKSWLAVNIALSLLLGRGSGLGRASTTRASWAVALLTFAAVVIRMEIAGLLGLLVIQLLLNRTLSITRLVKVGIISGLVSIGMRFDLRQFTDSRCIHTRWFVALTVSIDSYFWDEWPLWPEFSSIYFNVYEGKSAEWGVSTIPCRRNISLLIHAGIPVLDLLFNIASAPSYVHIYIRPIRFLS